MLFITKIVQGELRKGDRVYNSNEEESKIVIIEHIYDIYIDNYEEIDVAVGPTIVAIQGDLLKNSGISLCPIEFNLKHFLSPFFGSKLLLNNFEQLSDIKQTIKVMSFTEPHLKVKLNKYSELEFKCSGNVQFEKICNDLQDSGYKFAIKLPHKEFREFVRNTNRYVFADDNTHFEIIIGSSDDFNKDNEILCDIFGENFYQNAIKNISQNNFYVIESNSNAHIIENVLDVFSNSGSLINEKIINSFFAIKTYKEDGKNFFSALRNELSLAYLQSDPSICPLYYTIKLSLSDMYLGAIYLLLQKHHYLLEQEEFNDETSFYVIQCKIPQYIFNDFVEDLKIKSKGTAYLEVIDNGFSWEKDFHFMIETIKKEKGIYYGEKIIEAPEKQRTLRK